MLTTKEIVKRKHTRRQYKVLCKVCDHYGEMIIYQNGLFRYKDMPANDENMCLWKLKLINGQLLFFFKASDSDDWTSSYYEDESADSLFNQTELNLARKIGEVLAQLEIDAILQGKTFDLSKYYLD